MDLITVYFLGSDRQPVLQTYFSLMNIQSYFKFRLNAFIGFLSTISLNSFAWCHGVSEIRDISMG